MIELRFFLLALFAVSPCRASDSSWVDVGKNGSLPKQLNAGTTESSAEAMAKCFARGDFLQKSIDHAYLEKNNYIDASLDEEEFAENTMDEFVNIQPLTLLPADINRLKPAADELLIDIEALMLRFSQSGQNLNGWLAYIYKQAIKGNASPVGADYKEEPEKHFYDWILKLAKKVNVFPVQKDNFTTFSKKLLEEITNRNDVSQKEKMCLRELNTHFHSIYGQQNYNFFLNNQATILAIDSTNHDKLLNLYNSIRNALADLI